MMKLTIVGCYGAYPNAGGATSCYLIQTHKINLLLDCGSGALSQLQQYLSLDKLDAVVVSHFHHDHEADVGCIHYAALIDTQLGKRSTPISIYVPEYLDTVENYGYESYTQAFGYHKDSVLQIGDLTLTFVENIHPIQSYAIKVEDGEGNVLVYSGDTGYHEQLVAIAEEADLFLCECSLYAHQRGQIFGHLCSTEVGEIGKKANVGKLILTHLPHFGKIEQLRSEALEVFDGEVIIAHQGYVEEVK